MKPEERERYARHILLKEIGGPGQQQLMGAKVALVGAGGLGAPAALYLAAAGVGQLTLIDDDAISLSNLQRQVLYRSDEIGAAKVERAAQALGALNPHVSVIPVRQRLTDENAERLLASVNLVLDGTDDFATRFAVNRAAHALSIPLVSGAIGRWSGQVSVFAPGGPCYQCFVPEIPPDAETCAQVGVVGALAGVIGSMMALEAIKLIAEAGAPLVGRVLIFDGLSGGARTVTLQRDPACPVCGHA